MNQRAPSSTRVPATARSLLRYPADVRSLGFMATWFSLVAVQWALVPTTWWVALPLYAATCLFSFVGAVHVHNAIHCPVFRSDRLETMHRLAMTCWYGHPVSVFVPVHNHSHHDFAQTRRDVTRTTKVDGDWQLLNLWRATGWGREAGRDVKAYVQAQQARGSDFARRFRLEVVGLLWFVAALVVLSWWNAVLYVLIPQRVGRFCIKAINFLQHDGCDYDLEGYNHSRNFVGPVFNWLFLNNGFHTMHHLRPGVHWSALPPMHAHLVAPHIDPRLEVPNFARWFWSEIVWPGRRQRYDGAAWEPQPGGEGPDLPWLDLVLEREVAREAARGCDAA